MNIIEAAQAMREGKRVRLPWWPAGRYILEAFGVLVKGDGIDCALGTDQILSTDWEVVE